jgi:hypothetical protein
MTLFSEKNVLYTFITIGIVIVANTFGNKIKNAISTNNEDELIRKYLLNESPLYGYNRPKLWIHTKYEYNSRKWKSFGSRSSTDLNQPYIHLTIKSIINHCGDDFNVCLIDDDSFSQLIPGWKIQLSELPEPQRHHFRELGLMELLYIYGGLVVPNSFICTKNLASLYAKQIANNKPFVCEKPNQHASIVKNQQTQSFTSNSMFMGAPKRNAVIKDMIDYLKQRNKNPHFNSEADFFGYTSKWLDNEASRNHINIMDGLYIGVKKTNRQPVLIEDLLGEDDIELCSKRLHGILIPEDEMLRRSAYNWFPVTSIDNLLKSNMVVTKYLRYGITEPEKEQPKIEDQSRTVVSI